MITIFINLPNGTQVPVDIPLELNSPEEIKDFLEGKYTNCKFNEKDLESIENLDEITPKVSFRCYSGRDDYYVLTRKSYLSKMYIESEESLDFSCSDFTMDLLKGYDCCATELDLSYCTSLTNLEHIPQGITELYLEGCESLTSLEHIPQSITELNLNKCKLLVDVKSSNYRITSLGLTWCPFLNNNNDYIPVGCNLTL